MSLAPFIERKATATDVIDRNEAAGRRFGLGLGDELVEIGDAGGGAPLELTRAPCPQGSRRPPEGAGSRAGACPSEVAGGDRDAKEGFFSAETNALFQNMALYSSTGDFLFGSNALSGLDVSNIQPGNYFFAFLGSENGASYTIEFDHHIDPVPAPLPAALPLFASGLAGLGWLSRRRRKKPIAV